MSTPRSWDRVEGPLERNPVLLVNEGFFQKTNGDNNRGVSQESMAIVDGGRGGGWNEHEKWVATAGDVIKI